MTENHPRCVEWHRVVLPQSKKFIVSRIIQVDSTLQYQVQAPTTMLLNVACMQTERQEIQNENLTVTTATPIDFLPVGDVGNRLARVRLEPGPVQIEYTAQASLTPALPDTQTLAEVDYALLPAYVLPYLNPSRYCESDKIMKFSSDLFGAIEPGFTRVSKIADWVNQSLRYTPGSTGPNSSACDVLLQREGVCRDFAHVSIALCRALGIPARYVSGYAVDLQPPDFHGFFEAYLSDKWILFDATKLAPVDGFVRIGAGRDAADVAFATIIGSATMQSMVVAAADAAASSIGNSNDAVSSA